MDSIPSTALKPTMVSVNVTLADLADKYGTPLTVALGVPGAEHPHTQFLITADNNDRPVIRGVRLAACQCGDLDCRCECVSGDYPCEHGTAGEGCRS